MSCDAQTLVNLCAADKLAGLSRRGIGECLAYQAAQHAGAIAATVILGDGAGGFWELVVDAAGNLGTTPNPGPATSGIILADGSGGFWLVIVDASGLRGVDVSAGPATAVPKLSDGVGGLWNMIADAFGNLGTEPV